MSSSSNAIGSFWRELTSRRGFVALMVVASLALSIASFYTTFAGMTQYMGVPWVTALITFGLQGTMFAMAWIISNMLGTGTRNVLLMMITFAICAVVSIFFSFASLFSEIFDDTMRDQLNTVKVTDYYQTTVKDLDTQLAELRNAEHRDLIGTDAYQQWDDDVRRVASVARQAPEVIEQRNSLAANNLARQIQALKENIGRIEAEIARQGPNATADTARLERARAALTEKTTELETTRETFNELTSSIAVLEADMEAERTGLGTAAGEGPAFRRLRDQRDLALRERTRLEPTLDRLRREIEAEEAVIANLEGSLVGTASASARLNAELETLKGDLANAEADLTALQESGGTDLAGAIDIINRNLRVAGRSPEQFADAINEARNTCSGLYDALIQDVELQPQLSEVDCGTSELQTRVNSVDVLAERLTSFREQCQIGSLAAADTYQAFFDGATGQARSCIAISALAADEIRQRLSDIVGSRSPNAHPFVVAQLALLTDRVPLSYMAFLLAFIIDCLILLAALLANFVGKSRREKALRSLLNFAYDSSGEAYVEVSPKNPLFKTMQEEAFLLQLNDHGKYDAAQGKTPGTLKLYASARDYLLREIAKENGDIAISDTIERPSPSGGGYARSFP